MQHNTQQNHPERPVIANLMACSAALMPARHRLPLICYDAELTDSLFKSGCWPLIVQLKQAMVGTPGKSEATQLTDAALILSDDSLDENECVLSDCKVLKTAQYRQLLGQEWPLIVIDALHGLRANALAAAVGAVKTGGFLVIVAPPESHWAYANCNESKRLFGKSFSERSISNKRSFFIERLQHSLHSYGLRYDASRGQLTYREQRLDDNANIPQVIERIVSEAGLSQSNYFELNDSSSSNSNNRLEKNLTKQEADDNRFAEQKAVIEQICRVFTGHPRRPLVLTADRGRGKSSALGMAAARVVEQTEKRLLVTAPNKAAIAELMRWYQQSTVSNQTDALQFCLPEEILSRGDQLAQSFDGLLVDEAAGIPASLLTLMVTTFNRIVLSTTVQGYEGTGRGFEIRFKQTLNQLRPQWRQAFLHHPVRWGRGDPLEAWSNHALLLEHSLEHREPIPSDKEKCKLEAFTDIKRVSENYQQSQYQVIKPNEMMDEKTIKAAFGLLVDSHYQTTPDDFRQFLDHPDRYLFIQKVAGRVVGVALALQEGGISAEMVDHIQQGKRRLRGHLVAQSLAFHMNQPSLAKQTGWRIQRIAIHHLYRRCGFGKSLLNTLQNHAEQMQVDYLSSSFAASEDLLPFWFKANFKPVRLGLTRDPSSGCHSLIVVKPLVSQTKVHLIDPQATEANLEHSQWSSLYQHFHQTTRLLAASTFCNVSPLLMAQLLSQSNWLPLNLKKSLRHELTDNTKTLLQSFITGQRSFEDSALAVESLLNNRLNCSHSEPDLSSLAQLIARLWQGLSTQKWCQWFDASGKKNMEQRLRQSVKQLLNTE